MIAYAGAEGAFAHEACLTFMPDHRVMALPDFAAVVSAVEAGEAERGMLPLRNSRAGEILEVRGLLSKAAVAITNEYALPVRMHLLGLPGARLEDVNLVTSHPAALRQCAGSIRRMALATLPASNTALAARSLRNSRTGALASQAAAAIYGLDILCPDMQDDPNNMTLFALIEPRRSH